VRPQDTGVGFRRGRRQLVSYVVDQNKVLCHSRSAAYSSTKLFTLLYWLSLVRIALGSSASIRACYPSSGVSHSHNSSRSPAYFDETRPRVHTHEPYI